jgi:NAD(P)-dependent dehydrogenase (short-subunit alcohol dehydrogenase family)
MSALRGARVDARHLTGKTAVVTGAGSGIGRSRVTLLAQRGALVHAADPDRSSAGAVAQEVRDGGRQALAPVTHGRRAVPAPRYQVVPHWLLKRTFPPAGRPRHAGGGLPVPEKGTPEAA